MKIILYLEKKRDTQSITNFKKIFCLRLKLRQKRIVYMYWKDDVGPISLIFKK
jgi:hypothetical protein